MGNQLASTLASAGEIYTHDLPVVVYPEKALGGGRLLKSVQCLAEDGQGRIVVKQYPKRDGESTDSLAKPRQLLRTTGQKLSASGVQSVLWYEDIVESDTAGYLLRQFVNWNLGERVSSVPFLTPHDKKWISYQLLKCLSQLHSAEITHGDLKTNNVLLTTWNWVLVCDLAPFKPTFIPEDNPADFSFFFDTDGRRTCYLAPERFHDSKGAPQPAGPVTPAMDVFAAGCVIAELFLEGEPVFDHSQLLSYRRGDFDINTPLSHIEDEHVREMVKHMLQRDPASRLSASDYIKRWTSTVFPAYFETFYEDLLCHLPSMSPDARVRLFSHAYSDILSLLRKSFPISDDRPIPAIPIPTDDPPTPLPLGGAEKLRPAISVLLTGRSNRLAPDVALGNSLIVTALCVSMRHCAEPQRRVEALDLLRKMASDGALDDDTILSKIVPFLVALLSDPLPRVRTDAITTLALVVSKVESFRAHESHIFVEYILPSLFQLHTDPSEMVRANFAYQLPSIAATAAAFLELSYSSRRVSSSQHSHTIVGGKLVESERQVVEGPGTPSHSSTAVVVVAGDQSQQQTGVDTTANDTTSKPPVDDQAYEGSTYDRDLSRLHEQVKTILIDFFSVDTSTIVKRALLEDVGTLCRFFGRTRTNDDVLPMVITFLNSRDWLLRHAFFKRIVDIAAYVGKTSLQLFILPCILQALSDVEEFVIHAAADALVVLCHRRLFSKRVLLDLSSKIVPLVYHPNTWIRVAAIGFFGALGQQFSLVDVQCFVLPKLRPYLSYDILNLSAEILTEALKPPISRLAFDKVMEIMEKGDSTSETAALSASSDPEEQSKLQQIRQYVESASRAIMMKSIKWDNGEDAVGPPPGGIVELENAQVHTSTIHIDLTSYAVDAATVYGPPPAVSSATPAPIATSFAIPRQDSIGSVGRGRRVSEAVPILPPGAPVPPSISTPSTVPLSVEMGPFEPVGQLLGQSMEHKGAVYEVAVQGEGPMFLSCGADSVVRVWDIRQLERDAALCSVSSIDLGKPSSSGQGLGAGSATAYTPQIGPQLYSLCLPAPGYTAVGSESGAVHLINLERSWVMHSFTPNEGACGPIKVVRTVHVPPWSVAPLVLAGTQQGHMCGIDLRSKKESFVWKLPPHLGGVTAMCTDPNDISLTVGTSRGYVMLWDLRFQIPVSTHRHPGHNPIYKIVNTHTPKEPSVFLATGTNEIHRWRLDGPGDAGSITGVFRTQTTATAEEPLGGGEDEFGIKEMEKYAKTGAIGSGIRALYCGGMGSYLLGGGWDRKIRYFNLGSPDRSYLVAGIGAFGGPPPQKAFTTNVQPDGTQIVEELPTLPDGTPAPAPSTPGAPSSPSSPTSAGPTTPKPTRAAQVRRRPGGVGTAIVMHQDCILDMSVLSVPNPLLVSCSREGAVKIWK